MKKVYNVWKTDFELNPIDGTDRVLTGSNLYNVLKHLAYDEGVTVKQSDLFVTCKNGNVWIVKYAYTQNKNKV